jgi:hypothetical protein
MQPAGTDFDQPDEVRIFLGDEVLDAPALVVRVVDV